MAEQYTEEQKKRANECSEKVNKVLREYNCDISARVIINEKGTIIQKAIIANPTIITNIH